MKSPAAGATASDLPEVPVMTVWPSISAWSPGRLVGKLAGIQAGIGWLTFGQLFALVTIPISLAVYAWRILPFVARRYTLTSRRIVVQRGLKPRDERSVGLEEFDAIDIEVLDGQQWLRAGDLVFRRQGEEVFRLPGVSRPQPFREVCLKTRLALVSVLGVLQAQAVGAEPVGT